MWLENLTSYSLQVAALIVAATVLITLFRVKTPAVLLAFWQVLLAVCLLLPVIQPWHRQVLRTAPPIIESASLAVLPSSGVTPSLPSRSVTFRVYTVIAAMLLAGVGVRFLWLGMGFFRLHHCRHKSRWLSKLPDSILDMQRRIGISPEIFLSAEIDTPVTFGWKRPAVILPEAFMEMNETLQRPIACHELLHVRRKDWPLIVLEEVFRSLLWFHPAVWWALARIHLCREQVVDREVLRITGEKYHYLESLLRIASLRSRPLAVPAPLLLRERHLVQRVTLMLKESPMKKSRLVFSLATIAAFLLWTGMFATGWFPLSAPPVVAAPVQAQVQISAPQDLQATSAPKEAPVPKTPAPAPKPERRRAGAQEIVAVRVDPDAAETPAPRPQQREPIRVGGNIQESKLIKRVEPIYPETARQARVSGVVVLEVQVDEEGNVASVKVLRGHPLLDQAAIDAVKQWRYKPTYFSGQPVPVVATATVIFNAGGITTPAYRVVVDREGNLKDSGDLPVSLDSLRESTRPVTIMPGLQVPFEVLERTLKSLQAQGIQNFQLVGSYVFTAGRLFYLARPTGNATMKPVADGVEPPEIIIDSEALSAMARDAGLVSTDTVNTPFGSVSRLALGYFVCVNEVGEIVAVERAFGGPDVPQIRDALLRARVLVPGRRGNEPVPAALFVPVNTLAPPK
jgi:TonB family protein